METNLFEQAVMQAEAGRRAEARVLLQEVLRADPTNELAWVWYSDCADTVEEQAAALESCLRLVPDARQAEAGLDKLIQSGALDPGRTRPVFINDYETKKSPAGKGNEPVMKESTPYTKDTSLSEDGWIVCTGSSPNVFTVPPEQISPEEFALYESRAVAFLEQSYENRAREKQQRDPWEHLTQVPAAAEPRSRPRRQQPPVPVVRVSPRRRKHEMLITTLTVVTVLVMVGLLIGAVVLMRGA